MITTHLTYFFFPVLRVTKIYPFSKFPVFSTVLLTVVTMLYIRSLHYTMIPPASNHLPFRNVKIPQVVGQLSGWPMLIKRKAWYQIN